jgi:hypothetical protein
LGAVPTSVIFKRTFTYHNGQCIILQRPPGKKKKKNLQHNWRRDEIFDGMLEKREFSKLNYIISQQ